MKRSVSVRVSKWAQIIFIWTVAVGFLCTAMLGCDQLFQTPQRNSIGLRRYRSPRAFILTIIAL